MKTKKNWITVIKVKIILTLVRVFPQLMDKLLSLLTYREAMDTLSTESSATGFPYSRLGQPIWFAIFKRCKSACSSRGEAKGLFFETQRWYRLLEKEKQIDIMFSIWLGFINDPKKRKHCADLNQIWQRLFLRSYPDHEKKSIVFLEADKKRKEFLDFFLRECIDGKADSLRDDGYYINIFSRPSEVSASYNYRRDESIELISKLTK